MAAFDKLFTYAVICTLLLVLIVSWHFNSSGILIRSQRYVNVTEYSKPSQACETATNEDRVKCDSTKVYLSNYNKSDITHDSLFLRNSSNGREDNTTLIQSKVQLKHESPDSKTNSSLGHYVVCPGPAGRLGNMMFQLAAAIGVSQALKFIPAISVSHPLGKLFELQNVKRVTNLKLDNMKNVGEKWLREPIEKFVHHNLTVRGYFQSWKYFENASGAVRKAFIVKDDYLKPAKSFLERSINGSKIIIGMHVRRGDFLEAKRQDRGRVVADGNYTNKAMSFYRQHYKDAQFVICSDDKKWCKENIIGNDVLYSDFKDPIMDMAIMSLCQHMIITAGSFGWWGGWLAGGHVVYLSDFPRPGSAIAKELKEEYYLPHWTGMSNGL